jgi:hypothetical protein
VAKRSALKGRSLKGAALADQEVSVKGSRKARLVRHRGFQLSLVLAIGFGVWGMAAHDIDRFAPGATPECAQASRAQQVAWHRQQADVVELDSSTSLLRLFATIADELAAQPRNHDREAAPYSPSTSCQRRDEGGHNPRSR